MLIVKTAGCVRTRRCDGFSEVGEAGVIAGILGIAPLGKVMFVLFRVRINFCDMLCASGFPGEFSFCVLLQAFPYLHPPEC
jgi:hypothetical protein